MARKKKRVAKKSSKASTTRAKKKSTTVKKKSTASKSTKVTSSRSSRNTSVDLLLKRFAKERLQQESQLGVLRKKKEELEEKTRKYQEQITKMAAQEREAEGRIATLDKRRDQEVGELLANLGIQLGSNQPAGQNHQHRDHQKHNREHSTVPMPNGRNDNK